MFELFGNLQSVTMLTISFAFIGGIFSNIGDWLEQAWNQFTSWIKKEVPPIIDMLEQFENYIDSGMAKQITQVIPGQYDNIALNFLREAIDIVTPGNYDPDAEWKDALDKFFDYIRTLSKKERTALLEQVGSEILKLKAKNNNQSISELEAKSAIQAGKLNRERSNA